MPFSPAPERRRWWLWLLGAQMLFLLAVAAAGHAVSRYGHTVTLRTAPIDPRDLQRENYVLLNYDISQFRLTQWRGPEPPRRRQAVYVELQPTPAGFDQAVAVYDEPPTNLPADHAVLRGWVASTWRGGMRVRYGLEKYFVPEVESKVWQRRARQRPLLVHVSIAPWQQARITRVEIAPDTARR